MKRHLEGEDILEPNAFHPDSTLFTSLLRPFYRAFESHKFCLNAKELSPELGKFHLQLCQVVSRGECERLP